MKLIDKSKLAIGFTLTGHDELEPRASPSEDRIEAMRQLHKDGFKVWASIEPVIEFVDSVDVIGKTLEFCELYKIGLLSGKRYDRELLAKFVKFICSFVSEKGHCSPSKLYFKDGLLRQAGINRADLPEHCVSRDYDMF